MNIFNIYIMRIHNCEYLRCISSYIFNYSRLDKGSNIYIYIIPVPGPVAPPPMVWSPTRCTPDLTFTRCLQTQPAIACYLLRLGDVKPCLWAIRKHLGSPIPYLQAFRSIYALLPLLRTHTSTRLLPPPFLPCQRATYVPDQGIESDSVALNDIRSRLTSST